MVLGSGSWRQTGGWADAWTRSPHGLPGGGHLTRGAAAGEGARLPFVLSGPLWGRRRLSGEAPVISWPHRAPASSLNRSVCIPGAGRPFPSAPGRGQAGGASPCTQAPAALLGMPPVPTAASAAAPVHPRGAVPGQLGAAPASTRLREPFCPCAHFVS